MAYSGREVTVMNDIIELLEEHRSVRAYEDRDVPDEMLDAIIRAAWRAPSSYNAQEVSVVVVRDPGRRRRIAEIAGGQPWIAQAPVFLTVVIDYHKTAVGVGMAGGEQRIHRELEGVVMGAVDAGIALEALMVAARGLGLAIVPIGGFRRDPQAMIDLLKLPPLTFPVVGLCVGYGAVINPLKPRMALPSFRHEEVYQADRIPAAIEAYDREIVEHWRRVGRPGGGAWSGNMATYLGAGEPRPVEEVLRRQGFLA